MAGQDARQLIFVVEDEPDVRELIRRSLEDFGYAVEAFESGAAVLRRLKTKRPALCVVDLGLPDADGLMLVREIWENHGVGVIILTGRGDLTDKVLGLEFGADDYMVKPFEPRELVARVKSIVRRLGMADGDGIGKKKIARFGPWTFDLGAHTLVRDDGVSDSVSSAEAEILLKLLKAPKRVLSRDQLMDEEGAIGDIPFDRSIDVRVSRLRKKLEEDPKNPTIVKTVYGAGYLLAMDVSWE